MFQAVEEKKQREKKNETTKNRARCCCSLLLLLLAPLYERRPYTLTRARLTLMCATQPIHMRRDCISARLCVRASDSLPRTQRLAYFFFPFRFEFLFTFLKIEMFSSLPCAHWTKIASFRVRIECAYWTIGREPLRVCIRCE